MGVKYATPTPPPKPGRLLPIRGPSADRLLFAQQSARLCAIKTQKQISYGVPHSQREQAPPLVLLTIVKHMATLAKGLQISQPVIGGIMVKVGGGQRYRGRANYDVAADSPGKAASTCIAPGPFVFIPPSTIAQMLDLTAMRPATPLAPAFGSLKPDHCRKLRPVDRIKPFVLGADRHRAFQRRDDFAPIRQTRLIRDSRQRGGELFHETRVVHSMAYRGHRPRK
jgi:hypothetical protein